VTAPWRSLLESAGIPSCGKTGSGSQKIEQPATLVEKNTYESFFSNFHHHSGDFRCSRPKQLCGKLAEWPIAFFETGGRNAFWSDIVSIDLTDAPYAGLPLINIYRPLREPVLKVMTSQRRKPVILRGNNLEKILKLILQERACWARPAAGMAKESGNCL
jgi:hypothetical protein